MHAYQKQQRHYQKVEISTADPMKIVVLLYEGAIKNLNQAVHRIDSGDNDAASAKIIRTQDILNYLRNSLDHQRGGEISLNLERLYEYMRDTLNEAAIRADSAKLREVTALLQTLLEGWRAVAGDGSVTHAQETLSHAEPGAAAFSLMG
jgi:flagellar secretion chaperone FliS